MFLAAIVELLPLPLSAQNPIVAENQLAGSPSSAWYVAHPGDANIQGFATDMSVNRGDTVHFKIDTDSPAYHIDVYRLGWYQGNGARLVGTGVVTTTLPQIQPAPIIDAVTGCADCGNWAESAHWDVPANAVSGIYQAKLTRDDPTPGTSVITFLVRDDASTSDVLFQTSDTTWQAYNVYGGMSLYPAINGGPPGFNHATKVSYNRPFDIRHSDGSPGDDVFAAEYPMVRWLERNGYDVTYWSSVDTARRGNLLPQHRLFVSCGHDEYWSGPARAFVTAARDAGVHLAFFSGNEMYWKVRFEPSIDGANTPWRTLVCYKEGTQGENVCGGKCDPSPQWTGLWRDGCAPTYAPNDACLPENAVTGQMSWDGSIGAMQVPDSYKQLRFWRNTSIASLGTGQTATLCPQSLGSEWDPEQPQYASSYPSGRIKLSRTLLAGKTHHLSLYRADSGAFVFGAGTIQWSWGLDDFHTFASVPTNVDMQQATVNLFADMNAAPGSLQPGLVPATASTDTQAPASILASPSDGASLPQNNAIVVQGVAADAGGGAVGGVEVSVDGGLTWLAAEGTTNWSFTWQPPTTGTFTIKSRAFDDSGNLEAAGGIGSLNVVTVTVTVAVCPCTVFSPSLTPALTGNDGQSIELGMKFRATADGEITALRYYRPAGTTGTRIGNLWTSTGVNLAQQAFTADTGSGWQEIPLAAPVAITAGTTYVVSYFSPSGDYVATQNVFTQPTGPGPVYGLANGTDGPNGVYGYSLTSTFPTQTFNASSYFADVVFATSGADTTPPIVVTHTPATGAIGVATSIAPTITFSEAMDATTVNATTIELRDAGAALVPATVSYSATTHVATLTPTSPLANLTTYTAIVRGGSADPRVKDVAGNALATDLSFAFQTAAATPSSHTVFAPTDAPSGPLFNDNQPTVGMELGMRFRADVDGYVTAIRFYKAAGTTGTHLGSVWTNAGAPLVQTSFIGETASGWQEQQLAAPLAITANTTYVVSYFTSSGDYVGTNNVFTQAIGSGSVHGLANGTDGPNGVYLYTAGTAFPTQTFNASNYWVDVVFSTQAGGDGTPPTVTAHVPASNATGVPLNASVAVSFSEAIDPLTVNGTTIELRDPLAALVPATVSYSTATNTATLTPSAPLGGLTTYTVTVKGGAIDPRVKDTAGNALAADVTWSFTTELPASTSFSVFPNTTPTSPLANDQQPIELGMRFRADVDGYVTALRYYKPVGATGTHTGTLWSNSGTSLAQAVFTGESASGWQQVALPSPIAITAGTTYVVSYFSPSGDYIAENFGFTQTRGDQLVHGLADGLDGSNGVYRYTTSTAFPIDSFHSSNYWADVVFVPLVPDVTAPTVTAHAPASNATGVPTNAAVTVTFSEAMDASTLATGIELRDATNTLVPTVLTWNAALRTATLAPTSFLAPLALHSVVVRGGAADPRVKDTSNNPLAADVTWSFTTGAFPLGPFTVFSPNVVAPNPVTNDGNPIALGMKFRADVDGVVTALRYFKPVGATGTHTGSLWTAGGVNLAQAVFTNETASGWQEVTLPTPIAVTANTTYVVSYFSASGDYTSALAWFTQPSGTGLVHGLADGTDGPNGLFLYTPSPAMPTLSFNASNYFADVVFDRRHLLVTTPNGNGTVVRTPDLASYAYGSTVELHAQPDVGFVFTGWGGDASGTADPLSVTMNANKTIVANFAPIVITHTLAVTTTGNGSVGKNPDLANYAHGSLVELTATPAPHHSLVAWSGDATGTANPLLLTMDADKVVTATFAIDTHPLTVNVVGDGSVGRSPDLPTYPHGSSVELTATPALGYTFVGWSGDAAGTANPLTVAMDAAKNVTATFAVSTYPLSVTLVGSGSVARNPDLASYPYGSSVELTATPALGHTFVGWSGDATGTANPLTVVMDAAKNVTATFAVATYPLGVAVVGSGSVRRDPDLASYAHGSVVQLSATPAPGWLFTGWSGDATGTSTPVNVVMDAAKNVTATFVNGAGHEAYGEGCYDLDLESFWQRFPTAATASAALSGQSLVLTPTGDGYTVTRGGGAWIAPSPSAIPLAATDESQTAITPSTPMPIPGGSTATLWVHSNGFVSAGPQNGTTFAGEAPTAAFLDAPDTAWWSWHDFVPDEAGSGAIVHEEVLVSGHQVLCITWNGVESRAVPETANPSTLQFQFDLTSGAVTFVWQTVTAIGTNGDPLHSDATLVGFSPGGRSVDPGAIDFATALPIVTQHVRPLQLEADPTPEILGSGSSLPMTWTMRELPDAVPTQSIRCALLFFSFTFTAPLDLGIVDAPGCDLNIGSLDVSFLVLTGAGASNVQSLTLVFPPPLAPGMTFYSQAIGFFPINSFPLGLNGLGIVTSNGVKTTF